MAAAGPSNYPVDSFTSDRDPSHTMPRLFIIPRGPAFLPQEDGGDWLAPRSPQ